MRERVADCFLLAQGREDTSWRRHLGVETGSEAFQVRWGRFLAFRRPNRRFGNNIEHHDRSIFRSGDVRISLSGGRVAQGSSIEWTEATWNPVTGCTKVSAGCKHCYAERMAKRLQAMGVDRYAKGFALTLQPDVIDLPRQWKKGRTIFVNSMSDLFHEKVPADFVRKVFRVMNECPQHTFQILTKRPEIASRYAPELDWTQNIWMGTSVENMLVVHRIAALKSIPAAVRFLSLEPLIGPLPALDLDGIHWVIAGGESGPGARPMQQSWVEQIRDRCVARGVAFFFKQWGGVNKKRTGRTLDGRIWDEMPTIATEGADDVQVARAAR
ncbi:MAG TPA: phage Gp37/Gp68 family protein [Tepidisphaeraceae bacterium]|jgi:protein gp37